MVGGLLKWHAMLPSCREHRTAGRHHHRVCSAGADAVLMGSGLPPGYAGRGLHASPLSRDEDADGRSRDRPEHQAAPNGHPRLFTRAVPVLGAKALCAERKERARAASTQPVTRAPRWRERTVAAERRRSTRTTDNPSPVVRAGSSPSTCASGTTVTPTPAGVRGSAAGRERPVPVRRVEARGGTGPRFPFHAGSALAPA